MYYHFKRFFAIDFYIFLGPTVLFTTVGLPKNASKRG